MHLPILSGFRPASSDRGTYVPGVVSRRSVARALVIFVVAVLIASLTQPTAITA